jgi:hypothetical protein
LERVGRTTSAIAFPLKAELLAFPHGRHDDIVDALGLCGQLMDRYSPRIPPRKPAAEFFDKAYRPASDAELYGRGASNLKLL